MKMVLNRMKKIIEKLKKSKKSSEKEKGALVKELKEQEIHEEIHEEKGDDGFKIGDPYYCTECKRNHTKGKIYEEHLNLNLVKQKKSTLESKKQKTPEKEVSLKQLREKRIEKIAKEIAFNFTYDMIMSADSNESKGMAVHGYLQVNFKDHKDLIRKYFILDRAAFYAQKEWKTTPIRRVERIYLDDCVRTAVEYMKEECLELAPEQPFNKAIFYAPEALDSAVDWNDGVPKTVENFDTIVNLGYANLGLLDWALWNRPMILVLHAPGKDYGVFKVEVDPAEIEREKKLIQKKIIRQLRAKQDPLLQKVQDYIANEKEWRDEYTKLQNKMIVMRGMNLKKKRKELEPDGIKKDKFGDVLLIACLIIAVVFLFFVMFNMGGAGSGLGFSNSSLNNTTLG